MAPVEMSLRDFKQSIRQGIPEELPPPPVWDTTVSHAPARPNTLTPAQREQAVRNALRYFPTKWHEDLAPEFARELRTRGRIYMYRFRPTYPMYARPIDCYPGNSLDARAIMLMIQNNLDERDVALFPHELIAYGGNGTVFQNWAQYLITMQLLSQMTSCQTLHVYSGHPLGLFPSAPDAPRAITTAGMMVPHFSTPELYDNLAALGVTMYGQMTANGWIYIGPQGIVHGTTITILNAFRMYYGITDLDNLKGRVFVSSGLGGMSGAQGKAAQILGIVAIIAEVNPLAVGRRLKQGWIDEATQNLDELLNKVRQAIAEKRPLAIGYIGNVVDLWEALVNAGLRVDLASDQTSCHQAYSGGYYPYQLSFTEACTMIAADPERFRGFVDASLRKQVEQINLMTERGTRFFDYGNSFLRQARDSGAQIEGEIDGFRYPSYVKDLMGPICFDYGFGPFRWVCLSGRHNDLVVTDQIAIAILEQLADQAPPQIKQQYADNLRWIREAERHRLVVGSQARILYSNREGRMLLALAFNQAIRENSIGPVVIGRDHHDVSGTDSPYRETANIADGSNLCADMAVHNFAGLIRSGVTWACLHNGGGVGWSYGINGGFGLVLDGRPSTDQRIIRIMEFDVDNGLARRAWTGSNPGAEFAIAQSVAADPELIVNLPVPADPELISRAVTRVFE